MAWVSAIISAAGIVGGMIASNKASKAAQSAQSQQDALNQRQMAIAEEQWAEEKRIYGPLKEKMAAEALSDVPYSYGRRVNEVQRAYRNIGSSFSSRSFSGGPFDSGLMGARDQARELSKAEAQAGAYGQALSDQQAQRFGMLKMDNTAGATNNLLNAIGSRAAQYGQQTDAAGKAAREGYNTVMAGAGQLGSSIDDYINKPDKDKKEKK